MKNMKFMKKEHLGFFMSFMTFMVQRHRVWRYRTVNRTSRWAVVGPADAVTVSR
jgi:hypothetical protein